jgi:hypothetical protein
MFCFFFLCFVFICFVFRVLCALCFGFWGLGLKLSVLGEGFMIVGLLAYG